jgi:hypothetical protein
MPHGFAPGKTSKGLKPGSSVPYVDDAKSDYHIQPSTTSGTPTFARWFPQLIRLPIL